MNTVNTLLTTNNSAQWSWWTFYVNNNIGIGNDVSIINITSCPGVETIVTINKYIPVNLQTFSNWSFDSWRYGAPGRLWYRIVEHTTLNDKADILSCSQLKRDLYQGQLSLLSQRDRNWKFTCNCIILFADQEHISVYDKNTISIIIIIIY